MSRERESCHGDITVHNCNFLPQGTHGMPVKSHHLLAAWFTEINMKENFVFFFFIYQFCFIRTLLLYSPPPLLLLQWGGHFKLGDRVQVWTVELIEIEVSFCFHHDHMSLKSCPPPQKTPPKTMTDDLAVFSNRAAVLYLRSNSFH